jgi:recombination protein RecT
MNTRAQEVAPASVGGKFALVIKGPEYQSKFKSMLPPDVNTERFTAVVLRAVQEDPKLLDPSTDKASLFLACQRAAQDGLLPDKREGALVMYGNKVQWQAMIGGLRKRLAGAGFDLRAEVVHEHDIFDYDLGDSPMLTHKAPKLGQPRGPVIGAYAIAKNLVTGELYREVMDLAQLDAVANVSRSGSGGPWKGPFKTEMYRKTVGRRLIKSLPIDDRRLNEILERDNENFDLSGTPAREPSETGKRAQAAAREAVAPQKQSEPEPADGAEPPPDRDDVHDAEFTETKPPITTASGEPEF